MIVTSPDSYGFQSQTIQTMSLTPIILNNIIQLSMFAIYLVCYPELLSAAV